MPNNPPPPAALDDGDLAEMEFAARAAAGAGFGEVRIDPSHAVELIRRARLLARVEGFLRVSGPPLVTYLRSNFPATSYPETSATADELEALLRDLGLGEKEGQRE